MAKLQRAGQGFGAPPQPGAIAPTGNVDEFVAQQESKQHENSIELELCGGGKAIFRQPCAQDLQAVEEKMIRRFGRFSQIFQAIAQQDQNTVWFFGAAIAGQCCMSWGSGKMPSPKDVRKNDIDNAARLFVELILGQVYEAEESGDEQEELPWGEQPVIEEGIPSYAVPKPGESKRHPGWDAVEVTLPGGIVLTFDEPSQLDIQRRNDRQTDTEGAIALAAAMCTGWNGEPIKWSDALIRFPKLELGGHFRVAATLNRFPKLDQSGNAG